MPRRLAALAALLLPLAAGAQAPVVAPTVPADPEPPAAAPADPVSPSAPPRQHPPAAPGLVAAPPPPAAPAPSAGVTVEWSGWLQTHAWRTFGGLNATASGTTDLPLFAVRGRDAAGLSVRQSRVRAVIGLPAGGLLGGAKLRGFVETDFMGPLAGDDHSLPAVRLRHVWVAASWKEVSNLTLLVGQSWGVFTGPYFATSLAHLAVPRFGGAGFLFRRAPQIRLSGETAGPVGVTFQLAALAPYDKAASSGALAGERSGMPDLEGRVSAILRRNGKPLLELGASGHYGRLVYTVAGPAREETIDSWGASVDLRLEAPYLSVAGAGFMGEALGVMNSIAPGVRTTTFPATETAPVRSEVSPVWTNGFWVQGIVTPLPGLQLLAGYGIEEPRLSDLPTTTPETTRTRNQQVSGGGIVNLTSRWRVSTEVTWFVTDTGDRFQRDSTLVQVGSLYAF